MRARTMLILGFVAPYLASARHASLLPMSTFVANTQEDECRRGGLLYCVGQRSYYYKDVASLGLNKNDVDSIFGDLSERRS